MDGGFVTPGGIVIPPAVMTWRFSRGAGPGGQGVNTTDSRVELVVDLMAIEADEDVVRRIGEKLGTTIRVVVSNERSQLRNRETALRRLGDRLDIAARVPRRRTPTRPSAGSVRQRLDTKKQRSQIKANRADPGDDA